MKTLIASVLILQGLLSSLAYDLSLDSQKDTKYWKFRGNYIYAHSLAEGGRLAPQLRRGKSEPPTKGVWYFRNGEYSEDNDNYFEISYSLKHALVQQVWARLVAHPSVVISFKNSEMKELGSFRSSGKSWCDVVISAKLTATVKLTVNLTEPGMYAMVDKIILGVFAPVDKLTTENINPCSSASDDNHLEPSRKETGTENYEDLLIYGATTSTTTLETSDNQTETLRNNSDNEKVPRTVREAISTSTTMDTANVDGSKCDCSCKCFKTD